LTFNFIETYEGGEEDIAMKGSAPGENRKVKGKERTSMRGRWVPEARIGDVEGETFTWLFRTETKGCEGNCLKRVKGGAPSAKTISGQLAQVRAPEGVWKKEGNGLRE